MRLFPLWLLLALPFLTLPSPASGTTPEQLEAIYNSAEVALSLGNTQEAHKLFEQAAKKGHAPSMIGLGVIFGKGYVYGANYDHQVPANPKEAMAWFVRARDTGTPDGLRYYARLQIRGSADDIDFSDWEGLKNPKEGIRTLEQLAEGGDTASMGFLGAFYEYGSDDIRDVKKARHWYQKAVDAGYTDYAPRAEWFRYALDTSPEQKRTTYEQTISGSGNRPPSSWGRSDAFANYILALTTAGWNRPLLPRLLLSPLTIW